MPVPMYDTAWASLGFAEQTEQSLSNQPAVDASSISNNYSTGMAKLSSQPAKEKAQSLGQTSASKKKKKKKPTWPVEAKLMVYDMVYKLTTDFDKPAYTQAVKQLIREHPRIFWDPENGRKLAGGHAKQWFEKGEL